MTISPGTWPQWSRSVKSGVTLAGDEEDPQKAVPQWSRSVKSGVTEWPAWCPLPPALPQWSRSVKSGVTGSQRPEVTVPDPAAMEPLG